MNNEHPLQKEEKVRSLLEERFRKHFIKKQLQLIRHRRNGDPIYHEFDAVSEDESIIAEVKSDKYTTAYITARFPRAMLACRYLELAPANRKLIIFTDRQFYEHFKEDADGLVEGIDIVYADLTTKRLEGIKH